MWGQIARLVVQSAYGGYKLGQAIGNKNFISEIEKRFGPAAAANARDAYNRTGDHDEAVVAAITTGLSPEQAEQVTINYYRSRAEG